MSGLNLTEASHVIIMHPFYYGEGEDMNAKARAYEKQGTFTFLFNEADFVGIARAFRCGQTKNVVVTRFFAKDTIEEEMCKERYDGQAVHVEAEGAQGNVVDGTNVAGSSRS